ncbi:hypothetical protein PHAVU_L010543 [Phaseolus vulgaris]|uniref:DNA sliding clamp PCNA n=2 Tax=Phaseolus vulgaris TaxID=3885 RepID=V7BZ96_PHAVU|nr:hypothetical protein PHAVU_005G148900g [Phaseolus vulgaris]ESW22380.1 hypothetical protein PHAVU_005G148900g [Phaseolus vulgaris]
MLLQARMVQGSVLKKVVEVARNVAGERANLVFSTTGFSLQANNVAIMVAVVLPSDAFDYYHCDRTISIGISLDSMFRIFRVSSDDDIVTIKAFDGVDYLTFVFESPKQDKVSEFMTKDIDVVDQEPLLHISEAENHAMLKMPSVVFARIFSELADVGDSVTIKITDKSAKFSTKGEHGISTIICRQNLDVDKPEEAVVIEMNETVSVTFSLRLINSFTKTAPLCNTVTISFVSEMPSVFEYKIAETGYVRFFLRPREE